MPVNMNRCCLICALTALPFGVAQLQVSAAACRVLAWAIGAADVLDLAVDWLERGIHFYIVLSKRAGGLVGTHVTQGIGSLLGLSQPSKGRHVNARAWGTRRTRGSGVTRWTLMRTKRKMIIYHVLLGVYTKCVISLVCRLHSQQGQFLQNVHEVQVVQWVQVDR